MNASEAASVLVSTGWHVRYWRRELEKVVRLLLDNPTDTLLIAKTREILEHLPDKKRRPTRSRATS